MQQLKSNINKHTEQYKNNYAAMQELLLSLEKHLAESRFQGKEKHLAKARAKGKLLASERLELLLDLDSPFLELLPLAGLGNKKGFGVSLSS